MSCHCCRRASNWLFLIPLDCHRAEVDNLIERRSGIDGVMDGMMDGVMDGVMNEW